MNAPTTLPAEVARIVAELEAGPSTLIGHSNAAINATFDRHLIEASAATRQTVYVLRGQTAPAPAYSYSLEIS